MQIDSAHRKEGNWIYVPLSDLITPKAGRICLGPRWWAITENKEALFYKYYGSPQCHQQKEVVDRVFKHPKGEPYEAVFLEAAFVPHRCSDY